MSAPCPTAVAEAPVVPGAPAGEPIPRRRSERPFLWVVPVVWTVGLGLWGLSRQDSVWRDEAATWQVARPVSAQRDEVKSAVLKRYFTEVTDIQVRGRRVTVYERKPSR